MPCAHARILQEGNMAIFRAINWIMPRPMAKRYGPLGLKMPVKKTSPILRGTIRPLHTLFAAVAPVAVLFMISHPRLLQSAKTTVQSFRPNIYWITWRYDAGWSYIYYVQFWNEKKNAFSEIWGWWGKKPLGENATRIRIGLSPFSTNDLLFYTDKCSLEKYKKWGIIAFPWQSPELKEGIS